MKLSEAILLGSIGSEQGFGGGSIYKGSIRKCALGAALLGIGKEQEGLQAYKTIIETWPWTKVSIFAPVYMPQREIRGDFPGKAETVYALIWMLNDYAKWTRPQIAAWVAELEAIYDLTPEEVTTCGPSTMSLVKPSTQSVGSVLVDLTI